MILFLLAEVAPPPEILLPADAAIEAALAEALGFLGGLLRPVRNALVSAIKWVVRLNYEPARILWHWVNDLNAATAGATSWAYNEIEGLVQSVAGIHPQVIVQTTTDIAGAVRALTDHIDGAENYAISVSEDLYNRAVARADSVAVTAAGMAESAFERAVSWGVGAIGDVRGYAVDLHNLAMGAVDTLSADLTQSITDTVGTLTKYTDAAVLPLEGEIADLKPWAQAAAAAVGAEVFAKVITTVQSLYDPCCSFATDEVKPAWNTVKNLLGKLTKRGPLVLVVMGAVSEVVVSLDRPAIVAALRQAHSDDAGTSVAVLKDWRRPGVA